MLGEAALIVVRVRYFSVLADYAGTRQADVTLPAAATVRDLLDHLTETNPEPFRRALLRNNAISAHLRVFRNEKLVVAEGFKAPVAQGDVFMLFLSIAGGKRGD